MFAVPDLFQEPGANRKKLGPLERSQLGWAVCFVGPSLLSQQRVYSS